MDLGPNIQLEGFSDCDAGDIIVIKKLVGNHVKKLIHHLPSFERLELHKKAVHGSEIEIHGKLLWDGKHAHCDVTENNLFFALDDCLKKLETQTRE